MEGTRAAVLPRRPLRISGGVAAALMVAALIATVFWAILAAATDAGGSVRPPDLAHLLRMTVLQAGLTTVVSLLVGTALAWSLNRLRFPGRSLLVGFFASAIVTPGLIVAFGLLAVWGRNGWINRAVESVFGTSLGTSIFGLGGIVFAHAILDAAFAARVLLTRLEALPSARLKTGQSLGLSAWQRFRILDWPALAGTLPGLAAIIFLLAFTSFPIVLVLGGGPANQTFEVAIYSAVRLDFDLRAAVILALVQVAVCGAVILSASAFSVIPSSLGPTGTQGWRDSRATQVLQWTVLLSCVLAFALPLLAVVVDGFGNGLPELLGRPSFWAASATSLVIATLSALLALVLALLIAGARAASASLPLRVGLGLPAYTYLAIPAIVLSLGFFLAIRAFGVLPSVAAGPVVILANALLALPFAVATLGPPLEATVRGHGRLIRSLGLSGWMQWRFVEWPLIGREIGVVLALSFCFSLGDLGVIALFGTESFSTLPLLMYRALGAYRSNDAASIAALMLVLTVAVFTAFPYAFGRLADARR